MTRREHVDYWILPSLVTGLLIAAYFSGVPWLASIVSPPANRELGLLENLQNVVLIAVMVVACRGIARAPSFLPKLGFAFILLVSAFLILEEINYGQHYWNALHGIDQVELKKALSIHNVGDNSNRFKRAGDAVIVLFFVVLPLVGAHRGPEKFRYFVPPRPIITSVVAMLVLSQLAHVLNERADVQGSLGKSISEFRELFTYYIGLLYVSELALRRQWPVASHEARPPLPGTTGEDSKGQISRSTGQGS
jgi:hypothetical protein